MSEKPIGSILSRVQVNLPSDLSWEGTMDDYFGKVVEHPKTVETAHQRLFNAIAHYGNVRYRRHREEIIRWNIFDDPFDPNHLHAVYGNNVDVAVMKFVNVLQAAALGLGQEHRMYLLHGPIGTAKSTIAELLAKGLADYTKRPEGQLFAPFWIVEPNDEEGLEIIGTITRRFERTRLDCPLHEEPLAVFPQEIREPILKMLSGEINRKLPEGAKVELTVNTHACPQCAAVFNKLMRRYSNNWRQVVEKHLRVKRIVLSKPERLGIIVVRPKSEKDQDVAEFLGEHDFSKLGNYGSLTDPRTFDFSGYYEAANRGFFYWEEGLKFALSFLYDLLGASQEHRVQPKGFMEVEIDEVLLGSTNEPEYKSFKDNEKMQALRDRIIKVDIPYILEVKNEIKVYDKFFNVKRRGGKHLAPHTIRVASFWVLLTRVEDPKKGNLDRVGKVKLYDGQTVPGFNEDSIKELMLESEHEGMNGISPRYIHDKISAAFMAVDNKNCVNFFAVLRELKEGLRTHPHIKSKELREKYEGLVTKAEEELKALLKDDLYSAIVGDENAIKELFGKYIDHLTAWASKEKIKNPVTGEDEEADEDFMRAIEDMIEISDHEDFRQKIVNAMQKRAVQRERDKNVAPFTYKTDERLNKALQLYLFEQEKDKINWEALISRKSIDHEGQRRIDTIKERLITHLGYCNICAAEVMTYVASIFKRGDRDKKGNK